MTQLENIIVSLVLQLPPERIASIVEAMEGMSVLHTTKLSGLFGPNTRQELVHEFLDAVARNEQYDGRMLASMLRVAAGVFERQNRSREKIEMIWTGPATMMVPVRQTETALCEIINCATDELFVVSFVVYKVPVVFEALKRAVARGVRLNFLIEPSKDKGGHVEMDSISKLNSDLPQAKFYGWSAASNPESASIHAKCAVADGSIALITSANLTGKAMDANMELGVLVKRGQLPRQLSDHLRALVTEKIIVEIGSL